MTFWDIMKVGFRISLRCFLGVLALALVPMSIVALINNIRTRNLRGIIISIFGFILIYLIHLLLKII